MINILGKIFGSDSAVKSVTDLIDDIHTSDEEEIQAKSAAKTALLTAYAPFKIAQRYLAIHFTWLYTIVFSMVMYFTLKAGGGVTGVREVAAEFYIGPIMLTIVAFYFGGGIVDAAKRKFTK